MQRGGLSLLWLVIGIAVGIGAGLVYAWQIDPRIVTDIRPFQLSQSGKQNYLVAISLAYARDRDLIRTANSLNELGLDWQAVADTACELAQVGYAGTSTGLITIRAMVELAGSQGYTGCASALVSVSTDTPAPRPTPTQPSPTPIPVATKTPTPTLGPTFTPPQRLPTFTPTPTGDFSVNVESICDARLQNVIEVIVRDLDGRGIPGVAVEVIWTDDRERFFTGLKPGRDPGYADFEMAPGENYQVVLPGLSERTRRLQAGDCPAGGGRTALASYRVVFQRLRSR